MEKIDWDNPEERKIYWKKRYQNNREKLLVQQKEYNKKNFKKIKIRKKKWGDDNKEKISAQRKKYGKENSETIKIRRKKHYKLNKEKIRVKQKDYYKENSKTIKTRSRKYNKNNLKKIKTRRKKHYESNKERINTRHKKYYEENKKEKCIICSKPAPIKFCSKKCMGIGTEGGNASNWQGGKSFEPYPITWTARFKRKIRKRDAYLCMVCNRHQDELNRSHDVHHIDGDKDNTTKENCISLCNRHHSIVENNGKKITFWMPKFQKILNKLYGYNYERR